MLSQETTSAITQLINELDRVQYLKSNIEVVWNLECISKIMQNKANEIRQSLESEQAKD